MLQCPKESPSNEYTRHHLKEQVIVGEGKYPLSFWY